jgi:hypothetical protein
LLRAPPKAARSQRGVESLAGEAVIGAHARQRVDDDDHLCCVSVHSVPPRMWIGAMR